MCNFLTVLMFPDSLLHRFRWCAKELSYQVSINVACSDPPERILKDSRLYYSGLSEVAVTLEQTETDNFNQKI